MRNERKIINRIAKQDGCQVFDPPPRRYAKEFALLFGSQYSVANVRWRMFGGRIVFTRSHAALALTHKPQRAAPGRQTPSS